MGDTPPEVPARYALEFDGNRIAIAGGEVVVGRSIDCDIQLDDGAVSRRHARLLVQGEDIWVEDLGSANGVYVNGQRITGRQPLSPSDRIVVGRHALVLVTVAAEDRDRAATAMATRRRIPTRGDAPVSRRQGPVGETGRRQARAAPPPPESESSKALWEEGTRKGSALELMGTVAEKLMKLGRGAEAERMLQAHLKAVIDAARRGEPVDDESLEAATGLALKLARAVPNADWIDYVFDVHGALRRPLPVEIVDDIHAIVREVRPRSPARLRDYLAVLVEVRSSLTPAQRFAVQRLEGLERVIALG